jgi:transposase-like protein
VFLGDQKLPIGVPHVWDVSNGKKVPAAFGVKNALSEKAAIQLCQWRKRENILKYLVKSHQSNFRRKLQSDCEQPTYEGAKKKLNLIKRELAILNQFAVCNLEEGMEETLTLHRLDMFAKLSVRFKTTNCIENIMHQVGIYTVLVSYWKNRDQRQRWVGTALQENEPKLRTVGGYRHLREAMKDLNFIKVA